MLVTRALATGEHSTSWKNPWDRASVQDVSPSSYAKDNSLLRRAVWGLKSPMGSIPAAIMGRGTPQSTVVYQNKIAP